MHDVCPAISPFKNTARWFSNTDFSTGKPITYNNEKLEISAMSSSRGLNKIWCLHAMEYHVVLKNQVVEDAITWENVHNIVVKGKKQVIKKSMYTISPDLFLKGTCGYVQRLAIKEIYQDIKCYFSICSSSDFDFLLCSFWYIGGGV